MNVSIAIEDWPEAQKLEFIISNVQPYAVKRACDWISRWNAQLDVPEVDLLAECDSINAFTCSKEPVLSYLGSSIKL